MMVMTVDGAVDESRHKRLDSKPSGRRKECGLVERKEWL
jgi:hypothetical protein